MNWDTVRLRMVLELYVFPVCTWTFSCRSSVIAESAGWSLCRLTNISPCVCAVAGSQHQGFFLLLWMKWCLSVGVTFFFSSLLPSCSTKIGLWASDWVNSWAHSTGPWLSDTARRLRNGTGVIPGHLHTTSISAGPSALLSLLLLLLLHSLIPSFPFILSFLAFFSPFSRLKSFIFF